MAPRNRDGLSQDEFDSINDRTACDIKEPIARRQTSTAPALQKRNSAL
jgi:hypothetical protein